MGCIEPVVVKSWGFDCWQAAVIVKSWGMHAVGHTHTQTHNRFTALLEYVRDTPG